jgi:hypothetical protein
MIVANEQHAMKSIRKEHSLPIIVGTAGFDAII